MGKNCNDPNLGPGKFSLIRPNYIAENPKVFLFKMDFVVASDRDFWRWQSPAGTSPEQPQITTMKEKPSHHPEREIRAQQTRFGEQKNDRSNMSISKLNFEVMFYTHRSMCIRKQIVIWNFYLRVMVVSLGLISTDRIREQSTSSAFYR